MTKSLDFLDGISFCDPEDPSRPLFPVPEAEEESVEGVSYADPEEYGARVYRGKVPSSKYRDLVRMEKEKGVNPNDLNSGIAQKRNILTEAMRYRTLRGGVRISEADEYRVARVYQEISNRAKEVLSDYDIFEN